MVQPPDQINRRSHAPGAFVGLYPLFPHDSGDVATPFKTMYIRGILIRAGAKFGGQLVSALRYPRFPIKNT